MRYLHTMVRVQDIDASLDFYCNKLGLVETRRMDHEAGRFTLIFLAAPKDRAHAEEHRAPDARVRDVSANARLATHAEQPPLEIRLDREDGIVGHRRAAV